MRDLKALGANFDGVLVVTVEAGAIVLSENASEKPGTLFAGYKWIIKGPELAPSIVIQAAK